MLAVILREPLDNSPANDICRSTIGLQISHDDD